MSTVGDAEEWLAGNVAGVIKIGDTVHRQVGAWTPAVHSLLDHLAPRLPHIPRVLGFDEQGREVLDFMPGRVIDQSRESLTEAQIVSIVGWTRDFHAAVAGFTHPGPWRYFPVPEPTLIGHNDIAPYNSCFDGDDLVGVFDWDLSGPTTPLNELAFIAWNCVPLWADVGADKAARRVALIADAYGGFAARELLVAVPARIQLVAGGEPESDRVSLAGLRDRIPGILSQLP